MFERWSPLTTTENASIRIIELMSAAEAFGRTAFLAVLLLVHTAIGQESGRTSTAVVNVTVVDVEAGELRPARTVLIEGELIKGIGAAAELQPPAGARVVKGEGLFLIPGLIDSHVHYVDPDTFGLLHIANGVTLVREMGNATPVAIDLRDRLRHSELVGPEMVVTGAIIDGDPPVWPFSERCRNAEDGRVAVRKLSEAGVDQLKVYSRLPRDAYFAVIEEAKKVGRKVVGHVPQSVTVEEAVAAGQASLEHLIGFERLFAKLAGAEPSASIIEVFGQWRHYPKIDRTALAKILDDVRRAGTVICPTLVVMQGIVALTDPESANDPLQAYTAPMLAGSWQADSYRRTAEALKASLPMRDAFIGDLFRARVPLICGTDLANPNLVAGFSLHREMELFQRAGIRPADVVRSATVIPARFLDVGDRLGAVTEGRTASLVLVRKNPLEDVRNAAAIEGVFLRGHYYDREALDGMLEEVRAICAGTDSAKTRAESRKEPVLPGRPIASGEYVFTIEGSPAGTEVFKITEDDEGVHIWVFSNQVGGAEKPWSSTANFGRDLAFSSATWCDEARTPLVASYALSGPLLRITARRSGRDLPSTSIRVPDRGFVSPPGTAFDYATLRARHLEPGSKQSATSVSFGFNDWAPELVDVTIERHANSTIDLPGRPPVPVSHYTTTSTMQIGVFANDVWLDAAGVPVKTVTKTPFGTMEGVLRQN